MPQCWNCMRTVGGDAKFCPHCEADLSQAITPEEMEAASEVFSQLDETTVAAMFEAFQKSSTAEEFKRRLMVGECPKCGSEEVDDSENDPDINELFTGRCFSCGQLWCLECGRLFAAGETVCECVQKMDEEWDALHGGDGPDEATSS